LCQRGSENMSVTSKTVYEMFAEVYYSRTFKTYTDREIHVTEATQCLLKSFFQRKVPRALLEPKVVVLSFGNLIHEALREPLKNRGYDVEAEGKYELKDATLHGHTDALASDHTLEFKTISRMPYEPLSHHVLQDNAYNFIFDKPIGYVPYIHKPSGLVTVFPIHKREDQFQYVCLRAYRLSKCLSGNTTPQPEPSWLCDYCEYRDLCPSPAPLRKKRWL